MSNFFGGQVSGSVPLPIGQPEYPLNGSHTQNLSIDTAVTLTPPAGATHLIIQASVASKNVRLTLDGTAPTSSKGFVIVAQDPPVRIPVANHTFKIISETAGAGVDYQYETAG